jgi:pimeloyl-ACP methyl ester carboxylesterase
MAEPYRPIRESRPRRLVLRGLEHFLHEWGEPSPAQPTLVMLHGWMDVGASFQFVVDALAALDTAPRHVIAPDWRGFGRSAASGSDCYWFPDYLGDLDALLDAVAPGRAVDLLGHSMGGNVVMSYAGVRPARVRRLVNLEGFGLPASRPAEAPARLARWLDELRQPVALRDYASVDEVAERLCKNNPRLRPDRAAWLARHWAAPDAAGRWRILGDPAHKRTNPVPYRVDEILAGWRAIEAPTLWVEGRASDPDRWWGGRYTRDEFYTRLAVVPTQAREVLDDAGHMLHHDQPEALARLMQRFLATTPSFEG